MKLLGGKTDVLRGFIKRFNKTRKATPHIDIGLFLGDIQDNVITMMSTLTYLETILSRSHSDYLAQLSVYNIAQGNKTNDVLNKITILATILVPLSLVSSLLSMNVIVPFQDDDSLRPIFLIFLVSVMFVIFCLVVTRRMRYI